MHIVLPYEKVGVVVIVYWPENAFSRTLVSSIVMYNFGVGPRFAYVSASARAPK